MKKVLSIILSVLMLFSVTAGMSFNAAADDYDGYEKNGVSYFQFDTKKVYVAYCSNRKLKKVVIQSNVPKYTDPIGNKHPAGKVKRLFMYFEKNSKMTAIYIPKSVKYIGDSSFSKCKKLKHVYYGGSKADWKKIKIEDGNGRLKKVKIHYKAKKIK